MRKLFQTIITLTTSTLFFFSLSTANCQVWGQTSTNADHRNKYAGSFVNTIYSMEGTVLIDLVFEQDNQVSGYINFTNNPDATPLCGAGNFKGTIQGRSLKLSFVSNDPDPGCGSDRGLIFVVNATLSIDGSHLENGTYQINNNQAGVFQATSQTLADQMSPEAR